MRRALQSAQVVLLTLVVSGVATGARSAPPATLDDTVKDAFRAAYNLDQDAAEAAARRAVAMAPDDPRAHRVLASVLWVKILFDRGAVTVDAYLSGLTKAQLNLPKPAPALDAEFKQELTRAIDLANARLDRDKKDLSTRYELGSAYALQASYAASVDGSTTAAFFAARRAYDAHEAVFDADPHRLDAGATVGMYRYLVSGLDLPVRMFAYLAGFGGGKARGIAMIEAAAHDPEVHVEATTALVLVYSREGRDQDARRLLHELAVEFPRNRVFTLEEGAAAIRAGAFGDANAILSGGLDALDHDTRRKFPGERAVWLYKRGIARLGLNRLPDAKADLDAALTENPLGWIRGRVDLYLGKVADAGGDRAGAVAEYRQALATSQAANDPACSADAARFIKQPFTRR